MPRFGASQLKLPLEIGQGRIYIAHGHARVDVAELSFRLLWRCWLGITILSMQFWRITACRGPWQELPATGIANRIYATDDLVLRVAVEGQEALDDARTESVAAPVARAAGVCVPRMVAFDDSGTVVDRPYSLWERVHGETLCLFAPEPRSCPATWRAVGRQLALLHNRVQDCPDPHG